jgi:hypothetical protein
MGQWLRSGIPTIDPRNRLPGTQHQTAGDIKPISYSHFVMAGQAINT